jgi:ABC-type polysaccharide/polyol phosphate export permease
MFACKSLIKLILFKNKEKMRIPGVLFLRNLVERRSLLFQLVRRDFQQRFVGSAVGWIWGVIHPLVLLVSWWFVFSHLMKLKLGANPFTDNYPLYLFAGMLPWLLFSDTVQRSATCLLDQSNLITKTVFPSEIVPVSVFLSSLVSHGLALALVIVAAGVMLNQISIFLILLPVYIVIVGLLAVGVGWVVASLNVFQRDTAQVLSVILQFWFWLTPIFVTEALYRGKAHWLLVANPLSHIVRSYRYLLLTHSLPDFGDLGIAAAFGAAVFLLGGLFFRYMKRGFADVL